MAAEAAAGLPYWVFPTFAALVLSGVAAWLIYLNPRSPAIRAFALFLILRGLAGVTNSMWIASPDAFIGAHAFLALHALLLPFSAALIYFGSVHPRRTGWFGNDPRGLPTLALLVLALEALLFLKPSLLATFRENPLGGAEAATQGPFLILNGVVFALVGALALRFLLASIHTPPGPGRQSTFLIGLGFALETVFVSAASVLDPTPNALEGSWWQATSHLVFIGSGLSAAGVVRIAVEAVRTRRREDVRNALAAFTLSALAVTSALLLYTRLGEETAPSLLFGIVRSLWRLPVPILVTYALLRHSLFDIDLRLKWTIRQSTIGAAFIAVFFVVSEGAQEIFSESIGPYVGVFAAGALVFILAPLQRVAERIANAAMPNVQTPQEVAAGDRLDVYRTAVEMALADGVINRQEERALAKMAERLGLSPVEALEAREAVEDAHGRLEALP